VAEEVAAILAGLPALPPVPGGPTRQASVRAGLEALAADPPALVLVHDAPAPSCRPAPSPRCARHWLNTPAPSRPSR
jgi:2-C-methyl-D-erythritol 4-phosphate cytidylyltransferase